MSKKSRSKLWFLVHSWLALPIWFFVLIVCVTGTLAVVSQEIVWLATPEARAVKALDKLETIIQHNQGANPPDFDYAFNLHYGRSHTDAASEPVLAEIRALVDEVRR